MPLGQVPLLHTPPQPSEAPHALPAQLAVHAHASSQSDWHWRRQMVGLTSGSHTQLAMQEVTQEELSAPCVLPTLSFAVGSLSAPSGSAPAEHPIEAMAPMADNQQPHAQRNNPVMIIPSRRDKAHFSW